MDRNVRKRGKQMKHKGGGTGILSVLLPMSITLVLGMGAFLIIQPKKMDDCETNKLNTNATHQKLQTVAKTLQLQSLMEVVCAGMDSLPGSNIFRSPGTLSWLYPETSCYFHIIYFGTPCVSPCGDLIIYPGTSAYYRYIYFGSPLNFWLPVILWCTQHLALILGKIIINTFGNC